MNPLIIVKAVVDLTVSTGAGAIVGHVIKANTPASSKIITKICVTAGTIALSSMTGSAASKYVTNQIDSTVGAIHEIKATKDKSLNKQTEY